MPLSIQQVSVPVLAKTLRNLRAILEKGSAHAQARKIDDAVLLNARLFPDMQPLTFQVQVATDIARGGAARLAGTEPPKVEDKETTFKELIDRVDGTVAYIEGLDAKAFEGAEGRTITRPVRKQPHDFTAANYLQQFVLPNVFFHASMTYALLRHNGVELGKSDFLGTLD